MALGRDSLRQVLREMKEERLGYVAKNDLNKICQERFRQKRLRLKFEPSQREVLCLVNELGLERVKRKGVLVGYVFA